MWIFPLFLLVWIDCADLERMTVKQKRKKRIKHSTQSGRVIMARTVGIGIQDFDKMISNNYFYIDKTGFIKKWWESGDDVTLITRPRRFGKTLNLNMLDHFFFNRHAGGSSVCCPGGMRAGYGKDGSKEMV